MKHRNSYLILCMLMGIVIGDTLIITVLKVPDFFFYYGFALCFLGFSYSLYLLNKLTSNENTMGS
jgi:hypothetical protein